MLKTRKLRLKRLLFKLIVLLIIFSFLFILFEISSRAIIGKRLIAQVEPNGLYHFKPNQEGWYVHIISSPKARINNIGARGQDIDINLLNSTKKYIFLGDSFTFGWVLKDNETIPEYFKENLNLSSESVLNYGNGGYGIDHMIAAYEYNKNYFGKGDTIITILINADFYRPMSPYESSIKKELFWKIKEKSSFISWMWATSQHLLGVINEEDAMDINKSKDIFKEEGQKLISFNNILKKDKINLIYVFYEYNQTDYSLKAKEFCKENNLVCITNVYNDISLIKNVPIYTYDQKHPSNYSNKAVAEKIARFINKE
ncbi:MAG: hypothetical protein PHE43_02735 [Candidatus Nanoarchaeia archaeon]|nr:hypothetical protein [Candidatus Nanoarchaeia archaeon]